AARERAWSRSQPRTLFGARVVIVGGGSIGRSLARLLEPFRCDLAVLTRRTGGSLRAALAGADLVFLAVPLTAETDGMIGEAELRAMGPRALLVNVARGRLVRTD